MPREGVFRFATPLPKRVYRPFIDYESQIEIDDKVCRVPTKDAWGWKGDVIVTAPFCWHWFGDFYFFGVFGKYTLFFLIGLFWLWLLSLFGMRRKSCLVQMRIDL
ncbi:hypothetical protein [Alkalilimnicola ehrlichii]|uniref:Uncharacterized protein n=1 Tax=Alkalilimnicola ehrlichii TaxID=351052 RepID=A0A3E0WUF0_9GAMM|nr:hypothetical protein [Alkalilimnicola ehrlichii]RFA36458.1 hypothetical protein CAL65_10795 [Alkalilimnicola ehrlichii]